MRRDFKVPNAYFLIIFVSLKNSNEMKKIIWSILNLSYLGGLVQLRIKSALLEDGWFRSFKQKEAVDNNGKPIAWCTYPFLHFIYPRLKKHFDVFEYGCGNSTQWYSVNVKSIKSVEHDKEWLSKIKKGLPANATVVYKELVYGGDYCKEVSSDKTKYHIVIVDGRDRNNCLMNAIHHLTDDGIVIFDNSELKQYQSSVVDVMNTGFKRLDFYGMLPGVAHNSCTTILYKNNNCLEI